MSSNRLVSRFTELQLRLVVAVLRPGEDKSRDEAKEGRRAGTEYSGMWQHPRPVLKSEDPVRDLATSVSFSCLFKLLEVRKKQRKVQSLQRMLAEIGARLSNSGCKLSKCFHTVSLSAAGV